MSQAHDRYVISPFRDLHAQWDSESGTYSPPKQPTQPNNLSSWAKQCLEMTDKQEAYNFAKECVDWDRGLTLDEMIYIGALAGKSETYVREDHAEIQRERNSRTLWSLECSESSW